MDACVQTAARPLQEPMRIRTYDSFDSLPPTYDALFEQAARQSFCLTRWWFETLATNILGPGERLYLVGVEDGGPVPAALALVVGRERGRDGAFGAVRRFSSLSNYYTMVFAPLLALNAGPDLMLRSLMEVIATGRPRREVLRFQPLDRDSPLFDTLDGALKDAGLMVQPYFHTGNWYEPTDGTTLADYLERRPPALRNTIRRKSAALVERGVQLKIILGGPGLDGGIADYEAVYANSWKEREPYPVVLSSLMRHSATAGALRLGLLYLDGAPIAAQVWIVWAGKATLYKLAHDRRFDGLSPGTVLTMRMIERIIEDDGIAEIDFGVGDDPYKKQWLSRRRERWGLVAFNPRTALGILGATRHLGAARLKKAFHLGAK